MPLGYCLPILTSLDGLFGSDSLATKMPDSGLVQGLLDPQNTGDSIKLGENGHVKGADNSDAARFNGLDTFGRPEMKVKFKRPNQAPVVSIADCDPGTIIPNNESTFTLELFSQKSLRFPYEMIRNLCEDASKVYTPGRGNKMERTGLNTPVMNEVAETITGEMPGIVADVNTKLWSRVVSSLGTNANNIITALPSALVKDVALTNANGSLNLAGAITLANDKMINKITGKPIVVGGLKYSAFNMTSGYGCCSQDGVDYGRVYQDAPNMFYFDPTADTALGADQFLMFAPKAMQLVKHNRYQPGLINGEVGVSEYDTFRDSRLPMTWDIEVRIENCPLPTLVVTISLWYDLWAQPAVWNNGVLSGNRGIFRYRATSAV